MIYYNSEGKKIEFKKNKDKFINNGYCANVYKYDSKYAIKIYNHNCNKEYRLKKDMFYEIDDIKSDNLVKIYDTLYKKNIQNSLKKFIFTTLYKENDFLNNYIIDGYLMKYYEPSKLNILETDIEYMLQNMYQLEKLFNIFTNKSILVQDVKIGNIILGENNIVIIDPDLFDKVSYSYELLRSINNSELLKLFKSLFIYHYKFLKNKIPNFEEKNDKLFNMNLNDSVDVTSKISKKMRKLKYPIGYYYR